MFSSLTDVDVMRLSKLLDVIMFILLLTSLFLVNATTAEDTIENRVNASFDIEFVNGTNLNVDITMNVYKLTTYKAYDAEEIANASDEEMGALKYELYLLLKNQLEGIFENADISNFAMPTYDGGKFNEVLNVKLTSSFFEMNNSVTAHDFINGVLDMDAQVNYSLNLQAESGWNNTFKFILPKSMSLEFANTDDFDIHKNEITWTLENWDGEIPNRLAALSISFKNPTTSELEIEDISLEFELDTSDTKTTNLTTIISAKNIDIREYDFLPDFITNLDFVPTDGIRLFIDNRLISWDDFYQKTIEHVEEITVSKIENSSLNQTLTMSFNWDSETAANCSNPYNVTHMDNQPSIKAELTDSNIELQICSVSTRAVFGLINAGAKVNISQDDINFGDKLDEIGYKYNVTLYMPDNISLDRGNIYRWNQSNPISGEFESNISEEYSEEKIDTIVEIEMSGTDLNLISFFTGETELTMTLYMQETHNYSVTTVPDEFNLPEKVSLEYLNSDAFRLCIEEDVFIEDNVTAFLDNEKQLFEKMMGNIFQVPEFTVDGRVNRDAFDESLGRWDGNIADMDADTPVKVVSYAHSSYPVSFDLSFLPPKFEVVNQSFNFTGLQNQNVIYRMIFPHGTNVSFNDSLDRAVLKETDDGRKYIEISFNASEAGLTDEISCKIVPSSLFIVGIFMPCIVSLIITIILIIVIYIIRKKRKGRKEIVIERESEGFGGYEDQDYYVPPPPPSSK